MPFYQKGDVRIRYEETGSGFPLLVTPGGGLNSRVSNWPTAVFNAMEVFRNDFRCITMDQRNANGGESTGPPLCQRSCRPDRIGPFWGTDIKKWLDTDRRTRIGSWRDCCRRRVRRWSRYLARLE
jgi:pimeloyl-ACP methyl ester carboxylesterase